MSDAGFQEGSILPAGPERYLNPETARTENIRIRQGLDEIYHWPNGRRLWDINKGTPNEETVLISHLGKTTPQEKEEIAKKANYFDGCDWNADYRAKSLWVVIDRKDTSSPSLFQDEQGHIYAGDVTYYFDDDGHSIKEGTYTRYTDEEIEDLKQKGIYRNYCHLLYTYTYTP